MSKTGEVREDAAAAGRGTTLLCVAENTMLLGLMRIHLQVDAHERRRKQLDVQEPVPSWSSIRSHETIPVAESVVLQPSAAVQAIVQTNPSIQLAIGRRHD